MGLGHGRCLLVGMISAGVRRRAVCPFCNESLAELGDDLVLVRKAAFALLREQQPTVGDDVELALLTRYCLAVPTRRGDRGRETRGPCVVPASDGAVEDLDPHRTKATPRGPGSGAAAAGA